RPCTSPIQCRCPGIFAILIMGMLHRNAPTCARSGPYQDAEALRTRLAIGGIPIEQWFAVYSKGLGAALTQPANCSMSPAVRSPNPVSHLTRILPHHWRIRSSAERRNIRPSLAPGLRCQIPSGLAETPMALVLLPSECELAQSIGTADGPGYIDPT